MSQDLAILDVREGIATITFNRPDKRNAMSDAMRAEFSDALATVAADKAIRALVLTGAGKAFCAGGDVAGMQQRAHAPPGEIAFNGWHRQLGVHRVQEMLHTMPKPVIAAVNGAAAGLGADTALACDFIIASEHASFTWSYILRALVPDGGGLYFLPRRVGLSKAKELMFSGRKVTVEEALAIGIVDRVTKAETLLDDARAWATELSRASGAALALTKSILDQTFESSAHDIFALGSQAQAICYTSEEHRAAVMAFLARSDAKR